MIEDLKRLCKSVFAWVAFAVILSLAFFLFTLPVALLAALLAYMMFPTDARVAGFFVLFWGAALVLFLLDDPRR